MIYGFRNRLRQKMIDQKAAARKGHWWGISFAGRKAFHQGKSPVACPYPLSCREQHAWMAGWLSSYDRRYN